MPELRYIDNLLNEYSDSTFTEFQKIKDIDNYSSYNIAFYNILYTEIRDNEDLTLLECDSIINSAISTLSIKNNKRLLARAWFNKARIWEELNDPEEATKAYHNALENLEDSDDYNLYSRIYIDLGNLYIENELFNESLEASKKGLLYSTYSRNSRNQFISSRNMALSFLIIDQLDSAFIYFNQSFQFANEVKNSTELIDVINNDLAVYYHENGNYEEALSYLEKIIKMDEKNYLTKGDIFFETGKYDSAYYYFKLSEKSDDLLVKVTSYHNLYKLEDLKGKYKDANILLENYINGYDSIMMKTHTTQIYSINQKHNIRKTASKLKRIHNNRIALLIIIIILIVLTSIIVYININHKKKISQKNQEQLLLKQKIEISNLLQEIEKTKNSTLRLSQNESKIENSAILQKENDLIELKNKVDDLRSKLIMDKPLYAKIMKLADQKESDNIKVLNPSERKELKKNIEFVYSDFIDDLAVLCPSLTEEDIFFCCLSKLKLSLFAISICTGYSQTSSSRQRKYRIKKKMTEKTNNSELYNSIFAS